MNIPRDKMKEKDAYARKWFRKFGYTVQQVNKKLKKTFGTGMDPARLKRIHDRKSVWDYRSPSVKKVEKIALDHVQEPQVCYAPFHEVVEELEVEAKPNINDIMKRLVRQEVKRLLREVLSKI